MHGRKEAGSRTRCPSWLFQPLLLLESSLYLSRHSSIRFPKATLSLLRHTACMASHHFYFSLHNPLKYALALWAELMACSKDVDGS